MSRNSGWCGRCNAVTIQRQSLGIDRHCAHVHLFARHCAGLTRMSVSERIAGSSPAMRDEPKRPETDPGNRAVYSRCSKQAVLQYLPASSGTRPVRLRSDTAFMSRAAFVSVTPSARASAVRRSVSPAMRKSGRRPGMAVLNALSERLVVSTMHGGRRYRTVFSKGMIASLLRCAHCDCPLGTTWLTYRPDATIVAGEALTPDNLHGITERVGPNLNGIAERFGLNMAGVQIRVEDRMTEDADWY
jgi:hypothetical protein